MSLWDKIKGLWRRGEPQSSSIHERFRSWFEPHNIFTVSSPMYWQPTRLSAAVSRLSNSMSLPIKLYQNYHEVKTFPADLINNPNPNMTGFDFIRILETHRNTAGNGYALKEYDMNYQVRALRS